MSNAPNGASAFHRALATAARQQAEQNAEAADLRKRQLESGTIPAPTGEPCAWTKTITNLAERGKEEAAAQAEQEREYYERARREAGISDHA